MLLPASKKRRGVATSFDRKAPFCLLQPRERPRRGGEPNFMLQQLGGGRGGNCLTLPRGKFSQPGMNLVRLWGGKERKI